MSALPTYRYLCKQRALQDGKHFSSQGTGLEDSIDLFSSIIQQPLVCQGLPIFEAWRSHSVRPHLVGILWKSDQPDAVSTTCQHTTRNRQTYMLSRNHNPIKRATTDQGLRPRGHCDRRTGKLHMWNLKMVGSEQTWKLWRHLHERQSECIKLIGRFLQDIAHISWTPDNARNFNLNSYIVNKNNAPLAATAPVLLLAHPWSLLLKDLRVTRS